MLFLLLLLGFRGVIFVLFPLLPLAAWSSLRYFWYVLLYEGIIDCRQAQ